MFYSMHINIYNPSLNALTCSFQVTYNYNYDISFTYFYAYTMLLAPTPNWLKNINITIITFAALLILFTLFDTVQLLFLKSKDLDIELIEKRRCDKLGTKMPSHIRKFWVFDFYLLVVKIYLPSLIELRSTTT